MSGIDEVLEDFDMFVTPIHDGPSIGSVITPVAPPRASGSWARPFDAEHAQGRQIARRLDARGAPYSVPLSLMEEASRAQMSLVPARQCSLESVREGPTTQAFPEPQALPPTPVGKAGFEVWVFTKGGLVCTSNIQIGSYCRVSPPDSTRPSRGEVRPNLGCVRV